MGPFLVRVAGSAWLICRRASPICPERPRFDTRFMVLVGLAGPTAPSFRYSPSASADRRARLMDRAPVVGSGGQESDEDGQEGTGAVHRGPGKRTPAQSSSRTKAPRSNMRGPTSRRSTFPDLLILDLTGTGWATWLDPFPRTQPRSATRQGCQSPLNRVICLSMTEDLIHAPRSTHQKAERSPAPPSD